MSAREKLFEVACNDMPVTSDEVNEAIDAYAHELAEKIQDPEQWKRFGYHKKSMVVYMSAARRAARIIELEAETDAPE